MKNIATSIATALMALSLAGCAASAESSPATVTETVTATATVTATPSPSLSPESTPTPSPSAKTPADFGPAVKYTDGVEVSLSSPKKIQLTQDAEYSDGDQAKWKNILLFEVTLSNGSSDPIDPVLLVDGISEDEAVQQVWDDAHDLNSPPDAKLRPGKKLKWKFAVSVKDPSDVSLDVSPTHDHDSASFANS